MNRYHRLTMSMLLAVVLVSCASDPMRRETLDLMNEARIEDGLARLEQAAREHPDNLGNRADYIREKDRAVNYLLLLGDRTYEQGRVDEALGYYRRVLAIDSENARARDGVTAIEAAKRHEAALDEARALFDKGDMDGALSRLQSIFIENPNHDGAVALRREIEDKKAASSQVVMPVLKSKFKQPVTLQFRDANLKMVFEALSRTSGINILLDRDVKAELKTTIFVKDASVEDAIDVILMQNQLGKKVLNENTVFVYPNTPAKTKEFQDLIIRTFHLTNADAKQMQTMIKTMLKTKDLFIHEKTNSLVMRDTPEAVQLAEKLIATQDLNDPEVMLEVEVLEVLHSKLTELGIKWPNQLGLSVTDSPSTTSSSVGLGGVVTTTTSPVSPLTVAGLRAINSSVIKVAPLAAAIDWKKEVGDTNLLASPRIRVRQHDKAKILIGDRVPVITNSVTPVSTGTPVVTGNVQYLDVGLKLEVEPDIHMDGEVAIKTFLEVSSIAREVTNSSSGTVAYQIGTRTANTVLRLKDGETQVLAGLINDEDRKSSERIPGLGDLPIIGRLFSSHKTDKRKTEIILSITPHIVRNIHRPEAELAAFWSGTDAELRSKPLTLQTAGMVKTSTSASASTPPVRPPVTKPAAVAPQPLPPMAKVNVAPPPAEAATPTPAAANALAFSLSGAAQAKVGEQFKLAINVQSDTKVASVPLLIGFDPAALEVVDVAEGDFLKQGGMQTDFSKEVDQSGGQVSIDVAQSGEGGASGKGSVATVTFRVTAAQPKSQITVSSMMPLDPAGETLTVAPPAPHSMVLQP